MALAKAFPAVMVSITIDDSITAGNVEVTPVQNALPDCPTITAAPTTLPAKMALVKTTCMVGFTGSFGSDGILMKNSVIVNDTITTIANTSIAIDIFKAGKYDAPTAKINHDNKLSVVALITPCFTVAIKISRNRVSIVIPRGTNWVESAANPTPCVRAIKRIDTSMVEGKLAINPPSFEPNF